VGRCDFGRTAISQPQHWHTLLSPTEAEPHCRYHGIGNVSLITAFAATAPRPTLLRAARRILQDAMAARPCTGIPPLGSTPALTASEFAHTPPVPKRSGRSDEVRSAAAELGALGGKARAARLTAARRKAIAKAAAKVRWSKRTK
jgi:hypothetical protein